MPRSLDLDRLKRFAPQDPPPSADAASSPRPDPVAGEPARWPSREPVKDGQISIKAPLDTIARFKALCRDDRRTYADMLGILMDRFEKRD